ncbi:MAG: hypothetical protein OER90_04955 [Gemmatimonadota bacterium]|nr:hypothetical protein [Gemmatimonadota bacterium]
MTQDRAAHTRRGANDEESEEFGELLRFTLAGYVGGLVLGGVLDAFAFQRSAVGQWLVRTVSGEGESILEGVYALRQRLRRRSASMAEAYGWGKLLGLTIPWWIDWGSRLLGVDVYGIEGFYIPFFYAMADQIGGNVSGFVFLRRRTGSLGNALTEYLRHPVMLTGLVVIVVVPVGLWTARLLGFSPTTQVLTAVETILANLCWLPPAVGWWSERRHRRRF